MLEGRLTKLFPPRFSSSKEDIYPISFGIAPSPKLQLLKSSFFATYLKKPSLDPQAQDSVFEISQKGETNAMI